MLKNPAFYAKISQLIIFSTLRRLLVENFAQITTTTIYAFMNYVKFSLTSLQVSDNKPKFYLQKICPSHVNSGKSQNVNKTALFHQNFTFDLFFSIFLMIFAIFKSNFQFLDLFKNSWINVVKS